MHKANWTTNFSSSSNPKQDQEATDVQLQNIQKQIADNIENGNHVTRALPAWAGRGLPKHSRCAELSHWLPDYVE